MKKKLDIWTELLDESHALYITSFQDTKTAYSMVKTAVTTPRATRATRSGEAAMPEAVGGLLGKEKGCKTSQWSRTSF